MLQELDADPELGIVIDYAYEWALHLHSDQVGVLRTGEIPPHQAGRLPTSGHDTR